jgi:phenylalanyl-tRNA synthetase beta chain
LPGLLAAAARNRNRGIAALAMFEVGQAYRGDQPEDQVVLASGVRLGRATLAGTGRHWSGTAEPAGVFDAKADVFALSAALGFDAQRAQLVREAPPWFHPGRSGTLRLGPKTVLAHFGELHPDALALWELEDTVAAFEVFIDALPAAKPGLARAALEALDLLPLRRDFAFAVDQAVAAGDVAKAAQGADKKLIRHVSIFDVFEGAGVGEGKKSVAIEVTLQPVAKTLTEEEIEAVAHRIIAAVKKATAGDIRG